MMNIQPRLDDPSKIQLSDREYIIVQNLTACIIKVEFSMSNEDPI